MADMNSTPNFTSMSPEHQVFASSKSKFSENWQELISAQNDSDGIDQKTKSLCAVSVMAAIGADSGLDYMARQALENGANKQEVEEAAQVAVMVTGGNILNSVVKAAAIAADVEKEMQSRK